MQSSDSTVVTIKLWRADKSDGVLLRVVSYEDLLIKVRDQFDISNKNFKLTLEDGCRIADIETIQAIALSMPTKIVEMYVVKEDEVLNLPSCSRQKSPEDQGQVAMQGTGIEMKEKSADERMMEFIEKMDEKFKGKKKVNKGNPLCRLSVGWLHYSFAESRYIQVKNTLKNPSKPPTTIVARKDMKYSEVLSDLRETFFPFGKNQKGKLQNMICMLGNAKGNAIKEEDFTTLQEWMNEHPLQKARMYLLTKLKIQTLSVLTDESSSDEMELPLLTYNKPSRMQHLHVQHTDQQAVNSPSQDEVQMPSRFGNQSPSSVGNKSPTQFGNGQHSNTGTFNTYTMTFGNRLSPSSTCTTPVLQVEPTWGQAATPTPEASGVLVHAGTPSVRLNLPNRMCNVCVERECDAFFFHVGTQPA